MPHRKLISLALGAAFPPEPQLHAKCEQKNNQHHEQRPISEGKKRFSHWDYLA
jgi:hypothetical protein